MGLILVGLNHTTASLPVREHVVYSPDEARDALRGLKRHRSVPQALLLSTCNRTEVYAMVADPRSAVPEVSDRLFYERLPARGGRDGLLYHREGALAAEHLFRVACGLDSMVLGENEILGQVKAACEISRTARTLGTVLHRLATHAFRVGKRARAETRIGLGAVSVAYAAVELAEKVFGSLAGRGVLVMGAGKNGTLCAEHLLARGVEPLLIANRTRERAEALAGRLGAETVPFAGLREAMARVDIVVSTTASPEAIIDRDLVREVMALRGGRPLAFVDVAVPRNVSRGVDGLPHVFRFDMEALEQIVNRNVDVRREEIPAVESLVRREVEGFMRWWRSLDTGAVIRDMHRLFESIRQVEVEKNARRFAATDREQLGVFSRSLLRKVLMGMTKEIKHYGLDDPLHVERLAALRAVFHLDDEIVEADGEV